MGILMILILGLVVFVLNLIIATNIQNKKVKVMRDAAASQSYFNATKVLEDKIALYHFAIDDSKQEVYCYSKGNEIRFKYKDIVDFEIQVDGITTMSNQPTSKSSSEGINVVINTISMSMAQEVSSIKVRIILRNRNIDMYDIECLALRVKTNDSKYKETYMKAQSIFDTLKFVVGNIKPDVSQNFMSDIEELKELAALKTQGLITEEEFAAMKAKIISR